MKKLNLIAIVSLCLCSCTSDNDFENGKHQLEIQGYTNVQKTGYEMFCCSDEDQFSTGFKATGPNGEKVEGCFCSALGKGVTIRFK